MAVLEFLKILSAPLSILVSVLIIYQAIQKGRKRSRRRIHKVDSIHRAMVNSEDVLKRMIRNHPKGIFILSLELRKQFNGRINRMGIITNSAKMLTSAYPETQKSGLHPRGCQEYCVGDEFDYNGPKKPDHWISLELPKFGGQFRAWMSSP